MLKCPRTGEPMTEVSFGSLKVDVSPACAGIWFDRFELDKVDEQHEALGELVVEHLENCHRRLTNTSTRLKCPIDTDVVMMRRYFSVKQQIEIDECPACGGVWLDAEELEGIRQLFKDARDREAANASFASAVMASDQVQKYEQDHEDYLQKFDGLINVMSRITGYRNS